MREFLRIKDMTIPGGEDVQVNMDAIDCVSEKDGVTILTLRSGRVVRTDEQLDPDDYFPERQY